MKTKIYTLLLALAAGTMMAQAENAANGNQTILIDGNFSDWEALSDGNYAHCTAGVDAVFDGLYDAKFARDNDCIYFYLEFDGTKDTYQMKIYDETWTEVIDTKDVEGYYVEWLDFYLNCGDETTGGNSEWLWNEAAADLCIEGTWTDKFEGSSLYTWPADKNLIDDWLWIESFVKGATVCCDAVSLENSHMAIEGKIFISLLPVKPVETLKIGVLAQDPAWNQTGILPATVENEGMFIYSPLIEVPLIRESTENLPSVTGNPSPATRKLLRNGQLLINRAGKTYNAQGAKVK